MTGLSYMNFIVTFAFLFYFGREGAALRSELRVVMSVTISA
jgi:hypothetical protein